MTLIRGLSLGHLIALLINGIIGAGILGLPSRAFALAGGFSPVVWIVCGMLVAGIALSLAEVSSRYRDSGGPYLYALDAFGPGVGFMTGWLTLVSRIVAIASISSLLLDYAGAFTGGIVDGVPRVLLLVALFAALTTVLVRGIRPTAWTSSLLTTAKLSLLVGFVVIGLFAAPVSAVTLGSPPPFRDFSAAVALLLFAFFGFENGTFATGETMNPQRNMPIAIMASVGIATVLYLLVQVVSMAALPDLGSSSRPVGDAVERMLGARAGGVVSVSAIVMMLGTMLAVLVGATRLLLAMAEQGQIPSRFAQLHPRFRTPVTSIAVTVAAAFAASLFATFVTALAIAVTTRVLTYIVVCLAVPVLRRANAPPPAFRLRGGVIVALLSAAVSAWLITTTSLAELGTTAVVAVAGWILWKRYVPGPAEAGHYVREIG